MKSLKNVAKQYLKRSFSLPAANYKLASYHHDQCERSLRMHLFCLEKRDLTLVLTLFIAIGLFCSILASIAPQAHIFDSILISKSIMDLNSEPHAKQVERESIDMDLAPISSFSQAQKEIPTRITNKYISEKGGSQDQEDIDNEYETFVFTKPLNNLNKYIELDLRAKFNGVSSPAYPALPGSNKTSVKFKIGFTFETLDGGKNLESDRFHLKRSVFLEKEQRNSTAPDYQARQTSSPKNTGFRIFQHVNVTFDCKIVEHSRSSLGESDPSKTYTNNSLQTCKIPDLSVQFKLNHSKRRIYKITLKISDIKFDSPKKMIKNDVYTRFKLKSLDLTMLLSYTNSSFVLLTIYIRFLLLVLSVSIACCFIICLSQYKFKLWSLEQKWTALLLILLIGSNSEYNQMLIITFYFRSHHLYIMIVHMINPLTASFMKLSDRKNLCIY